MNLADKPVYPSDASIPGETDITRDIYPGITYKQWLVGMIASNSGIVKVTSDPANEETFDGLVVTIANAIIKRLEK